MRSRRIILALAVVACTLTGRAGASDGSLDALVAEVKAMKAAGASNAAIAEHVTTAIDAHITVGNSAQGDWARYKGWYTNDDEIFDRWAKYEDERESLPEICGKEYEARAKWSWDLGYGHCAEISTITYYVFKNAGIPARIFEIPGHSFTAMGVGPDVKGNDIATWGPDAYISDGWYGKTIKATSAAGWFKDRWGKLQDDRRTDVTVTSYDSPVRFDQCKTRGILAIEVVDSANAPVAGAPVAVRGGTINNSFTTRADGRYAVKPIVQGHYELSVKRGADSAAASVEVKGGGQVTFVRLTLPGGGGVPCRPGPTLIGGHCPNGVCGEIHPCPK